MVGLRLEGTVDNAPAAMILSPHFQCATLLCGRGESGCNDARLIFVGSFMHRFQEASPPKPLWPNIILIMMLKGSQQQPDLTASAVGTVDPDAYHQSAFTVRSDRTGRALVCVPSLRGAGIIVVHARAMPMRHTTTRHYYMGGPILLRKGWSVYFI